MSKTEYQRMLKLEGWLIYIETAGKTAEPKYGYKELHKEYWQLLEKYFKSKR